MKAHSTTAANEARHAAVEQKLKRLHKILSETERRHAPINLATIARLAGVSRTFLYENHRAKMIIDAARAKEGVVGALGTTPQQGNQDRHAEATWRERALNAETGLKDAFAEIGRQRGTIAELMGKIRDMESAYPDDSVHRITTENATFRRRVLQLEDANRALDERLKASRENARFMDRRLAELEVQLVENIDASPS